ncbi:MAG: phage portal protein [Chloroflexi bacterium]|nr:phage portal protein [Chloroflexota bacterium]
MARKQKEIIDIVHSTLFPAFKAEKERLDRIDKWLRWDHDKPHQPRHSTAEYKELSARAQTPWLALVVTSIAQALHVDGYRPKGKNDNALPWMWWQKNRLDDRQGAVHYDALGYGHAYTTVLKGTGGFRGDVDMPIIKGHSPRNMLTLYDEPAHDDYPHYALRAESEKIDGTIGYSLQVYDDNDIFFLTCDASGDGIKWIESREHGIGVCPVVRFANKLDNEGRTPGEVEPFIPIAGRIDQTVFDRLVVQRFSSWVVRTIAGMSKPDSDEEAAAERLRLKVEDILIADDADTKFGSLPASELGGFIDAMKADIGVLAAVSQTPAHEMLGQLANLSAEALAAARASLTAKVEERKYPFGESWEQTLRLAAWVMGEEDAAEDDEAQVKWRDTEIRSLAQAADALGKLAQMLHVPVEALWEKIPGWTQQDVEEAKALVQEGDSISKLAELLNTQETDQVDA